jgi:hypothetical protein
VTRRVARFSSERIPRDARVVIERFVRDAVDRASPPSRDAPMFASRTAMLLAWCHGQGLDLVPEVVLQPDTIDRFVAHGCAHLSPGSQSNYRSVLYRIGESTLGNDVYAPRRLPLSASDPVEPYSESEERALVGWIRGLPTSSMRDGALAVLGLGFGAGLTSSEMTRLRASEVESTSSGLVIGVEGARARRVPVTARWELHVREAVDAASGGLLFRPDRTRVVGSHVSRFVERLPRGDAPKLSTQRLRATWVVRHLEAGAPINVLAAAAGVGPERLVRYVPSMHPVDAVSADRLLRGEST